MVAAALFFDAEAAALLALLKRMIYTWINKNSFVSPEINTAEQRQKSFTDMMKVALGAEY